MIPIVIVNDRTRLAHLLGPPPFVKIDTDDVLDRIIKGVWKTQPDGPAISFEITGERPHHFKFRVLSQPYCEALPIDQYALTVGYEPPRSKTDLRITSAQIKFDGDRKKTNCLGMPSWITFKFSSSLNHHEAKVIVREQFLEGPDERNTRWSTVDKQRGLPAIICSEHAGLSAWIKADIHDRRHRVERVNPPADRKSIELEVPRHDVLAARGSFVFPILLRRADRDLERRPDRLPMAAN